MATNDDKHYWVPFTHDDWIYGDLVYRRCQVDAWGANINRRQNKLGCSSALYPSTLFVGGTFNLNLNDASSNRFPGPTTGWVSYTGTPDD